VGHTIYYQTWKAVLKARLDPKMSKKSKNKGVPGTKDFIFQET